MNSAIGGLLIILVFTSFIGGAWWLSTLNPDIIHEAKIVERREFTVCCTWTQEVSRWEYTIFLINEPRKLSFISDCNFWAEGERITVGERKNLPSWYVVNTPSSCGVSPQWVEK